MKPVQIPERLIRASSAVRFFKPNNDDTGYVNAGFYFDAKHNKPHPLRIAGVKGAQLIALQYVLRGTGSFTDGKGCTRPLYPGVFFHIDWGSSSQVVHDHCDFAESWVLVHRHLYEMMVHMNFFPANCCWRDIGLHVSIAESFEALEQAVSDPQVDNSRLFERLLAHLRTLHTSDANRSTNDELACRVQHALNADLHKNLRIDQVDVHRV